MEVLQRCVLLMASLSVSGTKVHHYDVLLAQVLFANTRRLFMMNDATDSQLLAQEEGSIKLLARQTDTEIAKVQQIFLIEYKKLASHAHITAFLSLLTCNCVRAILDSQNAPDHGVAKP
jgi:hypothetical protein